MRALGGRAQFELAARSMRASLLGAPAPIDALTEIRRLLQHAYDSTAFYRDKLLKASFRPEDLRAWADFAHVPTVTKEELLVAGDAALALGSRADWFLSRTSGSSGRFLSLYQDSRFWIADSLIGIDAYGRLLGLCPRDLLLYVNTSTYPYHSVAGLFYRVSYFDGLRPIAALADEVVRRRPAFLMVYPSIGQELIRELQRQGLRSGTSLGIRAMITHSEQSSQPVRQQLGSFFGCPTYDEYATEELGRVGLQCSHGTVHLLESESYCEILDDADSPVESGQVGEVTGTCLTNYAMPIIRYRQGDDASIVDVDCSCGISGRALGELLGRANDSFRLPHGGILPSGRLLDWTYQLILSESLDIRQFQLVQTRPDLCEFRMIAGTAYRPDRDDPIIQSSFRRILTPLVRVVVRQVTVIDRVGGKHRAILSSLGSEHPSQGLATWKRPIGERKRVHSR